MKCNMCGRSMSKPAYSIRTKDGWLNLGPVCAKRVVVVPTRTRHPVVRFRRRAPAPAMDPRQLPLWGVAA